MLCVAIWYGPVFGIEHGVFRAFRASAFEMHLDPVWGGRTVRCGCVTLERGIL